MLFLMPDLNRRYVAYMNSDLADDECPPEMDIDPPILIADINATVGPEGWAIFDSFGSDNGPWQIQRFDDPDEWTDEAGNLISPIAWEDDCDVWMMVVSKARSGSEIHQRALDALMIGNPLEAAAIVAWIASHQLPAST